jgi:hypothetical protein
MPLLREVGIQPVIDRHGSIRTMKSGTTGIRAHSNARLGEGNHSCDSRFLETGVIDNSLCNCHSPIITREDLMHKALILIGYPIW